MMQIANNVMHRDETVLPFAILGMLCHKTLSNREGRVVAGKGSIEATLGLLDCTHIPVGVGEITLLLSTAWGKADQVVSGRSDILKLSIAGPKSPSLARKAPRKSWHLRDCAAIRIARINRHKSLKDSACCLVTLDGSTSVALCAKYIAEPGVHQAEIVSRINMIGIDLHHALKGGTRCLIGARSGAEIALSTIHFADS